MNSNDSSVVDPTPNPAGETHDGSFIPMGPTVAYGDTGAKEAERFAESESEARSLPKQIGRFRILGRLGSGGFGIVFLAFDDELNRKVALKLARVGTLVSPEATRRFVKEARTAAQLDHPHIVPVFETGHDGEACFIVSAYCAGPSLAQWLFDQAERDQPVAPRLAAQWMKAVAGAVEYAHKRGIVHRDLKPSNILLEPLRTDAHAGSVDSDDGSELVPRLTDFGIAKVADDDGQVTMTGTIIGTPHYMAPEQAEGRVKEIGPPADVYALGVVLYEILTDRPPISGETDVDTLRRIGIDEPKLIRGIRPDVHRDLEAVCLKCMEKEPRKRYASAGELALDLGRYLAGEPVKAHRRGPIRLAWAKLRKTQVSARTVLLISILAACSSAAAVWRTPTTLEPPAETRPLPPAGSPGLPVKGDEISEGHYFQDMMLAFQMWEDNARKPGNGRDIAREMEQLLSRYLPREGQPDIRGFEWRYLWRLCHPTDFVSRASETKALSGHDGAVFGVQYSPDGRLIATASADRTARLWNAGTGDVIHVLNGHDDDVSAVAFSPDGRTLATCSDDHTIKLFETASGNELTTLIGHADWVCDVEFAPHGEHLASAGRDGILKVWNLVTNTALLSHQAHDDRIMELAYSPDGRWLATVSDDGRVKLWDAGTYELAQDHGFYSTGAKASAVAFSHDSRLLAVGGHDRSNNDPEMIVLFDVTRGQPLEMLGSHSQRVHVLKFSTDDLSLYSISEDGNVLMWDLATQTPCKPIDSLPTPGWSLDVSPTGTQMAVSGSDGIVRIFDTSVGLHCTTVPHERATNVASALTDDGRLLATGIALEGDGTGGNLKLWDISSNELRLLSEQTGSDVYAACFSRDSKEIAVGAYSEADEGGGKSIRILNVASGEERIRLHGLSGQAQQIEFASEQETLIAQTGTGGESNWSVDFWNTSTGHKLGAMPQQGLTGEQIAIADDGSLLAMMDDGRLRLYDCAAQQHLRMCPNSNPPISGLDISPDNRFLASSNHKRAVIDIWNASDGELISEYQVLPGGSGRLTYAPDGKTLVVNLDRQLMLVDVASGQRLISLRLPYEVEHVDRLAFSADGRTITAVASLPHRQKQIYLWRTHLVDDAPRRIEKTESPQP